MKVLKKTIKKALAGQNAAAPEMFSRNGYAGTNIRELSAFSRHFVMVYGVK